MKPISQQERLLIMEYHNCGADPSKIAKRTGIHISAVRRVIENKVDVFHPISPDGWGRLEIRDYVISRRHVFAGDWPLEDREKIAKARFQYDCGDVEVCQGRDGDWMVLYAIPRKESIQRPPYFARVFE